jgi:PhnB protein
MQLNPYLNFDGRCEEAFKFYQKCLGGRIVAMSTYGETPAAEHVPPECHDRVIHARLVVGDAVLMGSDCPPGRFKEPQSISVSLQIQDPAEAERISTQPPLQRWVFTLSSTAVRKPPGSSLTTERAFMPRNVSV